LRRTKRKTRPLATFATAQGDCEDYAIAKYVALQEAGFHATLCKCCWFATAPPGQDHGHSELLEDPTLRR
jgi:predicted transglutaminase-like cysteine proteinase